MSWGIDSYDPHEYDGFNDGDDDWFEEEEGCIFADQCLNPICFHTSDECYTLEMMEDDLAAFGGENQ